MKLFLLLLLAATAVAKEIDTNQVHLSGAPAWMQESKVREIAERIGSTLEWDIRKIQVTYYEDKDAYAKVNRLGPLAVAFTRRADGTVHLGPGVTPQLFEAVFGHELAHVILLQKYKDAIPKWLEEGLANHVSKLGKVDYVLLKSKPILDVTKLAHPYGKEADTRHVYQSSQALMEMIANKCSLTDLLQLSVGKKLETYLKTYCQIPDVNAAYKDWVTKGGTTEEAPSSASDNNWWRKKRKE